MKSKFNTPLQNVKRKKTKKKKIGKVKKNEKQQEKKKSKKRKKKRKEEEKKKEREKRSSLKLKRNKNTRNDNKTKQQQQKYLGRSHYQRLLLQCSLKFFIKLCEQSPHLGRVCADGRIYRIHFPPVFLSFCGCCC